MGAAVLRPRGVVVPFVEGTLLAVADGADASRVDAEGDQVILGGVGAAVAEGQVVLLGAALVAVAFDEQVVAGALAAEPGGRSLQGVLRGRVQRAVVVVEVCVLDVATLLGPAIELL